MSPMRTASPAPYAPTADVFDRHEYGVCKNRKSASTGGGRAWSDDEEVYLLQTRLQKMPYKHIAAHLKKTELACRLHYHQLSHGSNRRKRTTSVSSGSSASVGGHSPRLSAAVSATAPHGSHGSPTPSPPGSSDSYLSLTGSLQLPSILGGSCAHLSSPHLPTILPKPVAMMGLAPCAAVPRAFSPALVDGGPGGPPSLGASLLPAATLSAASNASATPVLRLDCSALPPPPPPSAAGPHHPVDMARLQAIYTAHCHAFWDTIAREYGAGAHPAVLEQAWRAGVALASSLNGGLPPPLPPQQQQQQQQTATPLTPGSTSPDDRDVFYSVKGAQDKTRISAILGIDANPRSPSEREIVRRLEEERVV